MKTYLKLLLALTLTLPSFGYSWNYAGHKIVATIAYDSLTPKTRHKVNQLLKPLGLMYPDIHNFTQASIWPDLLKSHDVSAFNSWHFINYHYTTSGKPVKKILGQNVLFAIAQSKKTLSSHRSLPIEKAMALGFLIHFIGDVHQPLHAGSRITEQTPKGDKGGNLFLLKGSYRNLHALWDAGLGQYKNSKEKALSKALMSQYPQRFFKNVDDLKPSDWAMESLAIAKGAYAGIEMNEKPSQKYLREHREQVNQRVVLAGYRLARVLEGCL